MKQKYTIDALSGRGLSDLIKAVKDYPTWLNEKTKVLLQRLSNEGYQIASAGFSKAQYDGTNDVQVRIENRDEHTRAIVAVGASVLFIEFGTGIVYPDNHPEAAEHNMVRGEYGLGRGKRPAWGYYGDPGTNGMEVVNRSGKTVVITRGNPANMAMYNAVKNLQERLPELIREVFNGD